MYAIQTPDLTVYQTYMPQMCIGMWLYNMSIEFRAEIISPAEWKLKESIEISFIFFWYSFMTRQQAG